jgi:hypothetical protein
MTIPYRGAAEEPDRRGDRGRAPQLYVQFSSDTEGQIDIEKAVAA